MRYGVFPGSFKPPHAGHLSVVKKMLPKVDKFYVIISNKPRGMIKPFDKKLGQFNKGELEEVCQEYRVKPCDKKKIEEWMEKGKIPNVSAKQSLEIWEMYRELLPKSQRDKLKIMISRHNSPVIFAYIILNNMLKKGDELYLLKSKKDEKNERFSLFKKEDGVKIVEELISTMRDIYSSGMRRDIFERKKKSFEGYLPDGVDKNKIWKLFS